MATTRVRHYYDDGGARRTAVIIVVAYPCGRQVLLQHPGFSCVCFTVL